MENGKGYIICDCGKRYYNSKTCEDKHMISKYHLEYLEEKEKGNNEKVEKNERGVYYKKSAIKKKMACSKVCMWSSNYSII
jgi:hypothetical protein